MTKSSQLFRLALVPFGLLLIVLFSWNTMASAAQQTVTWTAPANLSNSGDKSVYPSIAYDAQGHTHIIWLEYDSGDSQTSRVMYTNNINGSFISPFRVVSNAGKNVEHITALAVETNRVHIFYTSEGKSLRHTVLTLSGATPSVGATTTISQGKGYAPAATVDSSGRVHVAWIDNRTGTYQVYHRIWTNGNWDGGRSVRPSGNTQDSPSIVATRDGRVHVVFSIDRNPLNYSIFDGNGWSNGPSPSDAPGNISGLATDGTTIYAVWSNKDHRVLYAENAGNGWQNRVRVSDDVWSDYPTIAYSSGNNKIYAAWSSPESPNSKIYVREIGPGAQLNDIVMIGNTAPSTWARAAGSPNEVSIAWQDKSPGSEEIRYVRAETKPVATPTPLAPSGSLELADPSVVEGQNGELYTNQASVNATIRYTGGAQPNQYGLSDGGDPGDPNQPFSGPQQTVPFTLNTSDNSCRPHQVNGRLQGAEGSISPLFGDSIIYDPSVEADIQVHNPNLGSDVPTPTIGNSPASTTIQPSDFGDPYYTNMSLFYLSLRNASAECSGLRSYTVTYTDVPKGVSAPAPETKPLTNGGPGSAFLPGTVEGTYRFQVTLSDNAGNTRIYPDATAYSMTFDNTAPEVKPVTNTITPTQRSDGLVNVDLGGVTVTDNLYRAPDGRQYYGVWIVVRRADLGLPSDTDWQFKGVAVAGNASNLKWNMAMGLADQFIPGKSYKMYIRFVDGAANVSDQTIVTAPIRLDALKGPRQFLPQVYTR